MTPRTGGAADRPAVGPRLALALFAAATAVVPACSAEPITVSVTVTISGNGSGVVTASAIGLRCTVTSGSVDPRPCQTSFADNDHFGGFTLTARPTGNSTLSLSATGGLDAQVSCAGETCNATWDTDKTDARFTFNVRFTSVAPAQVQVSPATTTIDIGETINVSAEAFDATGTSLSGQTFSWTSSDPSIATVAPASSTGSTDVTGVSPGVVTIQATTDGISDAATVTVEPGPPPAVVEIAPATATLDIGDELELTASARDGFDNPLAGLSFDWASADVSIATVDPTVSDGPTTVTAVDAGTVEITAATAGVVGNSMITVQPGALAPVVFEDDFSVGDMWDLTVLSSEDGATETHENRPDGGVTGAGDGYRHMTHAFLPGGGSIFVQHLYTGGSYRPQADGAIDCIDYSEWGIVIDPAFAGAAVGYRFLVVQNGVVYTALIEGATFFTNVTWEEGEALQLRTADFSPAGLDFSAAGEEIFFGFQRANSSSSAAGLTATHGIDDWRVEVVRVQP